MNTKAKHFCSALIMMLILLTGSTAAGTMYITTNEQANQAYNYALQYVENEVAYLYGGRLTVEAYLAQLESGLEPGVDIGVDASALVVNAYRQVIPNIRFYYDESRTTTVADATSSILFNFNCKPISQEELVPGDLIFFKGASGRINGVAIFSAIKGNVIHFITASANAGKVVLTNAFLNGNYWTSSFAGFGRLQYTVAE